MVKKTIYFICNGNSMNDIIQTINKLKTNSKRSTFNYIYADEDTKKYKKIDIKDDPSLIKLGIKELNLFQENKDNRLLLQNFKRIYTSLDTCSIESVFVLYKTISGTTIFPLPNMITNKEIYNLDSINKFKTKFGKLSDNKTTVSSYWNKNHDNDIKKINTVINWQFISNSNIETKSLFKQEKTILSNAQFKFHNFEQELINIFIFDPNESILIVSHYDILVKILDRCTLKKFIRNKTNIEVSSIWKIDVEYTHEYIKYLTFDKIYPTPYNYIPLEYIDNKYKFFYNNSKCILFNSGNIPEEYLIYLNDKTLPSNIRNKLPKINNSLYINNKKLKFTIDNFK